MTSILARLAAAGATTVATVVARRGAERAWRATRGEDPPDPTSVVQDDTELRDVLLWSLVLAGAVFAAGRVASMATHKALDRG